MSLFSKKIKFLLSFVMDFPLEHIHNNYHSLEVSYYKGQYALNTYKSQYSFGTYYKPFSVAFQRINFKSDIQKVLLLGLGIGSIPQLLLKYGNQFQFTCIEIDKNVISLAKKYLPKYVLSKMEIIHQDAYEYIGKTEGKFDLIAMDVFIEDVIPPEFQTREFLQKIQNILAPDGILIYNRLITNYELKKETEHFYKNILKNKFPTAYSINTEKNRVLIYDSSLKNK